MTVPVITTAQPRPRRWGRLRGCWAVFVLLLSALDHLVSAVIGSRPVTCTVRRFAVPVAAAWRSGRYRRPTPPVVYLASPASERNQDDGSTRR